MKLLPLILFIGLSALAAENEALWLSNVKAEARTYTHSCSYYSNTEADIQLTFKSDPVDSGTRVFLEYGWEGTEATSGQSLRWFQKTEKEMSQASSMGWTVSVNRVLAERSSPTTLSALNFVFRIQEPGKSPRYVGGTLPGDTFVVHLSPLEQAPCVTAEDALPAFREVAVQIERNN